MPAVLHTTILEIEQALALDALDIGRIRVTQPMSRIFISYRRADAAEPARQIYNRLAAEFGDENVFKDVDSIPLGSDFTRVIVERMGKCQVAIIVMGRSWVNARDQKGKRRLDNPADFVRIEVVQALGSRILVIPVLVGNATMPAEDELPVSLRPLARRNALVVRPDADFDRDIDRLVSSLRDHLDMPAAPARPTRRIRRLLVGSLLAVLGLWFAGAVIANIASNNSRDTAPQGSKKPPAVKTPYYPDDKAISWSKDSK